MEKNQRNHWTKERCAIEALKYSTRSDFWKYSKSAYNASIRNKWLNEISYHMHSKLVVWDRENCHQEALKYKTRSEFNRYSLNAYRYALKEHLLDEICSHMIVIGNKKKRCIYVFEFGDNFAYVGLTYNTNKRIVEHLSTRNSQVYKHVQTTNLTPVFKQLTDYLDVSDAMIKENDYLTQYENNGWKLLNKAKTGALGGNEVYWTIKKCHEEALKYEKKYEFMKGTPAAYSAAYKNGWLVEICEHMIESYKPDGYWNIDKCHEDALKYDKRNIYQHKSKSSYNTALRNGWLDEICQHMPIRSKKHKNDK